MPGSRPEICTGVEFLVAVNVMVSICQLVLLPKMVVGVCPFTLIWASARLWAGEVVKTVGSSLPAYLSGKQPCNFAFAGKRPVVDGIFYKSVRRNISHRKLQ